METNGAKVILTSPNRRAEGSRDDTEGQVEKGGYKMQNQFVNPKNEKVHKKVLDHNEE